MMEPVGDSRWHLGNSVPGGDSGAGYTEHRSVVLTAHVIPSSTGIDGGPVRGDLINPTGRHADGEALASDGIYR